MTNLRNNTKIDMTTGAILPKMLRFALPIIAASILQLLFNAADIAVVGKFCGDNALAAVSSNGPMVQLLTNLFIGFSTGANVMVSRYYASKEEQNLTETVHTAMLLAVLSGIAATIVGICSARAFLTMMQSPADVIDLAALYLHIYFIGSVPVIVYNFGAAILRAVGDTQRPLYILMASGVLNVVLNLVFVLVFHMSVAGVALATILSQTLSAALVIRCLMREEEAIRLIPKKLCIVPDKLKKVLQIGFPAGIQSTLFSISNVVIQSSINSFGSITMSGNGAAQNIEGFGYMAFTAFYQAILSFTSQNYGKKCYRRILRVQLVGQLCSAVVCLLYGILILLFGRNLLAIYSDTPAVIEAGMLRFAYIVPLFVLGATMDMLSAGLRGMGYSLGPMLCTFFGVCVVRLIWIATVFQIPAFHHIGTIYIAYPITWGLTTCIHLISFTLVMRSLLKDSGGAKLD